MKATRRLPFLMLTILAITLFGPLTGSEAATARAQEPDRTAVVYYNEACDECAIYVNGELAEIMAAYRIRLVRKDYINHREHRAELNELNQRLGIPLELQSHLAIYIDDGRIVVQGQPPRPLMETLLDPETPLPERILVYREEDDVYRVWAFAGPVQVYPIDTPLSAYLTWFEANRSRFRDEAAEGIRLLLPAVLLTGLLDGINPCALAILLFFVSFLLTIRKTRLSVARMGLVYIAAVYVVYFLIGLGLLRASTLLQGHWLGQIGALLLILIGLLNVLNALFPRFPIRLEVPEGSKQTLQTWMYRATLPATLVLGTLVGLHTFPCSGGPYVAILGLLASQTAFWEGVAYLVLYNLMFILPLVVVLILALNPVMGDRIRAWERSSSPILRAATGAAMALLGLGLLLWVV